ncbi:ligand-gated channel [Alteromonas sp. KC3]|uniref:TonB-dependent siderophore receptor n=1 Tax=unclassified Alteromonas TaxID=2614992 RepID=UPI00192307AF|nr:MULTISPECIES: TonB-dependent siderophore receptor [unclassified Alteromonas]BCO17827.1 ligand-gated channel [Alteromonas sp. KC3]BCO21788.1 ligand-gated channel [Alteromonas sp. KC14]
MKYIAAVITAALATNAFAQESGTTTQNTPQEANNANAKEVERVVVTSRALNLYRNGESSTGKLSVDPLNSTQQITTINESLIRDQGARNAKDIYRNIAGVSQFSYAGVTARGFRQEEIFFDGLRGDPYVGFNVPQLFNVERLDFLKGPAGMLYGAGAPGGLFNYVTKKPQSEFSANARAIAGSHSRVGGSGEITGALSDNQNGRLGVFYEEQDTYRDNSASEVFIFDSGYSYDLNNHLFTAQYTHYSQDLDGNRLRGVPTDDAGNFLTDRAWNHNEASDFLNLRSDVVQLSLEGQITSSMSYDTKLRYIDNEQEQNYHEPRALIDSDGDGAIDLVGREFRDQLREQEQISFAANFVYEGTLFNANQRTAFGVDLYKGTEDALLGGTAFSADFVERYLAGTSLDSDIIPLRLTSPNYGESQPSNYDVQFRAPRTTEQVRNGAYVLNELAWDKFTLVTGVRYDTFEDDSNGTAFDDNNVTYRLGAIYKVTPSISLYGQWADSYEPQAVTSQTQQAGGPFEPTTGEIIEGGVNAELFDETTLLRMAVYQIKRQNLLQNTGLDPEGDGIDNLAPVGEVTSDGIEIEVISDITPNWIMSVAYSYNDARITADNGGTTIRNSVGDQFANAPENQLGFWTRYQVPEWDLAFAFGGNYVDEQLSLSGQTVKSYFVADASITWEVENYSVLFRIDNLFDREYAESGFLSRTGHFPGNPRNGFVEFTYKW